MIKISSKNTININISLKETGKLHNYRLCDVRVNVSLQLAMDNKNETRLTVGKNIQSSNFKTADKTTQLI